MGQYPRLGKATVLARVFYATLKQHRGALKSICFAPVPRHDLHPCVRRYLTGLITAFQTLCEKVSSNLCDRPRSDDLLNWYDQNARVLPWRIAPALSKSGYLPDPYRVWLSEIMLQQTTVAAVKPYFLKFTSRWPDVRALASAQDPDVMAAWAGLGYYARARNLLKCARAVTDDHNGVFPQELSSLLKLPGIGPYTAAAISAIAFQQDATVVDGNVERVMARLHAVQTPLPDAKIELTQKAARLTPTARPGDYAQAVMDLGATVCTPKKPSCDICPWCANCGALAQGITAELPKKRPKPQKPTRYGIVYYVERADGAVLLERRPDRGLLGGMLGWPGSAWDDAPKDAAPVRATWTTLPQKVRHTFTHFHLELTIKTAQLSLSEPVQHGAFIDRHQFRPAELPTVMRKVFDLVNSAEFGYHQPILKTGHDVP
ncbi:MAG: A/G-specific adenine glycosylase [Marinovum sp.]|nr:A/G-specific adenine glycosylase [Marinovum sp.]